MNPMIPAAIIGGGMGLIEGAVNRGGNRKDATTAYIRQRALMDKSQQQQYEMWEKTNYGPQMEQMRKAGLNPALMYGTSGGGATTTGSSSGSAPMAAPAESNITKGAGMAIELGLMKAQKENIEADTVNKQADAANKGANTTLTLTNNRIAEIEEAIKGKTSEDAISYIADQARLIYEEVITKGRENQIGAASVDDQLKSIREGATGIVIENELKRNGIAVAKAQIEKMAQDIAMGWEDLSQRDRRIKLEAWGKELEAQTPGLMQVAGKVFNNVLEGIDEIFSKTKGKRRTYNSPEKTGTK